MGTETIVIELNKWYASDHEKYKKECDYWKSKGYKIYRDNRGRHKVIEPQKEKTPLYPPEFKDLFGDIFGNIFGGTKT